MNNSEKDKREGAKNPDSADLAAFSEAVNLFSAEGGLNAESIRFQRKSVTIRILNRAREKIQLKDIVSKVIPNKILVPMLEKASLEENDSDLIDRWASLFASTSSDPGVNSIIFSDILSSINGDHVRLLDEIASPDWKVVSKFQMDRDCGIGRGTDWVERIFDGAIQKMMEKLKDDSCCLSIKNLHQEIDIFNLWYTIELFRDPARAGMLMHETDKYYFQKPVVFEVLGNRGLIEKKKLIYEKNIIVVYAMTELGIEFINAVRE